MLKLSARLKEIPFELEDQNGEVIKLKASEMTVADLIRVMELQKPIFGEEKSKKLTIEEINKVSCTRLAVAIKYAADNKPFFDIESMDDFPFDVYPKSLLEELANLVEQVNPKVEDLEEQKKS